jgi:hypothetical protein
MTTSRKTYHGKGGRFANFDSAHLVTQGGKKFRVTRTLEPIDGDGQAIDSQKAESILAMVSKGRQRSLALVDWLVSSGVLVVEGRCGCGGESEA